MLVDHVAHEAPKNPAPAFENAFVAHYGFEFAPPAKTVAQKVRDWFNRHHGQTVEHWLAW